jgi:hypothetical protein
MNRPFWRIQANARPGNCLQDIHGRNLLVLAGAPFTKKVVSRQDLVHNPAPGNLVDVGWFRTAHQLYRARQADRSFEFRLSE